MAICLEVTLYQLSGKIKSKMDSLWINNIFKYALKSYACSHKFYDSFQVRAYTSAGLPLEKYSKPVLFYANSYLFGGEHYHFCMVQYVDTLHGIETYSTCPTQILVFVKYESRGIPTPGLIDTGHTLTDIEGQNIIDTIMYAFVHTAPSYISWEDL